VLWWTEKWRCVGTEGSGGHIQLEGVADILGTPTKRKRNVTEGTTGTNGREGEGCMEHKEKRSERNSGPGTRGKGSALKYKTPTKLWV